MTGSPEKSHKQSPQPERPATEVPEKAKRRSFTAEYKRKILQEVDACAKNGDVGELLRREGLYSSHIVAWRNELKTTSLKPQTRGRKPKPKNAAEEENKRLRRENERLALRLKQAEVIIDVQKKVSEILGIQFPENNEGNDS